MTCLSPVVLMVLSVGATPPQVVAFALEVRGTAEVSNEQTATREIEDGDALREGDKITVKSGGAVTVYFRPSGPVATFSGPADAKVLAGKLESSAAVAVRDVKVPTGAAAGLERDKSMARMGGVVARKTAADEGPPRIRPAAGRAVLECTPAFAWQPVSGAKAYRVELFRADADGDHRVWVADAVEPRLPFPAAEKPLARGKDYLWRVTTNGGSQLVVPDVKFGVLDEAAAADAVELAPLEQSADPNDWLLAAVLYAKMDLNEKPIALLEKVAAKRPDSGVVWKLLQQLYEAAGRVGDGEKARARLAQLAEKK